MIKMHHKNKICEWKRRFRSKYVQKIPKREWSNVTTSDSFSQLLFSIYKK